MLHQLEAAGQLFAAFSFDEAETAWKGTGM
jgi:hypothetical protein